ncbi:MAG: hypothetical protein QNJ44_08950 [Rhodobacter sp.]|nr:hypothetical protein [Rhodobacter sp.]
MSASDRVPEHRDLASEADRLIVAHLSEVRDYTAAFHASAAERGLVTIDGPGWAVRPLFLPAHRLDFVGRAFDAAVRRLVAAVGAHADDAEALYRAFPFGNGIADALAVRDGIRAPAALSYFRPDGFLFEDRYVLSEINYGNGIVVSTAYTELTSEYWRGHPVLRRLGLDHDTHHPRPLQRYIASARRFARPVETPSVAMLIHSDELATIREFPERVMRQIDFAFDRFREAGLRPRLVDEAGITLDQRGDPVFTEDGARIDLIQLIAVGVSFLDQPELLKPGGTLEFLRGGRCGSVAILKPLAGLLLDKGALPHLCADAGGAGATGADGFAFRVAWSEFPADRVPGYYEASRRDWVIKRSFDGKDTHPGITRSDAVWRRQVGCAMRGRDYIAQRYISLPKARLPVLVDGRHLEQIESRVELSSFVFDGEIVGSGIRHAPEAEGHVMTDFPEGYGYTTAYAV